ncbi:MAG: antibiotic biosynthesis monooxygenase [Gammaproteobacteria bacterium]|nr:antibiotic biosynthesis monooxygenase [Gammaproteobacteria bacterium]
MQTAFIATLIVKQDKVAEFEQLQKKLSDITHDTEPGTLVYDFIKHREQANTYVVYARFKDEAAFQLHQDAPAHDELVPPILAALAEDMDLQFYELVD